MIPAFLYGSANLGVTGVHKAGVKGVPWQGALTKHEQILLPPFEGSCTGPCESGDLLHSPPAVLSGPVGVWHPLNQEIANQCSYAAIWMPARRGLVECRRIPARETRSPRAIPVKAAVDIFMN